MTPKRTSSALAALSMIMFFSGCGSGDGLGGGDNAQSPDPATRPLVLDSPRGFKVTLPAGSTVETLDAPLPGATYQAAYGDELGNLYIIFTYPADSIPSFSAGLADTRFDGAGETASGDFLIIVSGSSEFNETVVAVAKLANDEYLYVGTDATNPLASVVFASIDLVGTDGRDLEQDGSEDALPSLNLPADGFLVLADAAVYEVSSPQSLQQIAAWSAEDKILVTSADSFDTFEPFFLTRIGEWVSVSARYVDEASFLTIDSTLPGETAPLLILLNDGTIWEPAYGQSNETARFAIGADVALVEDSTRFSGHVMIDLTTGTAIDVSPSLEDPFHEDDVSVLYVVVIGKGNVLVDPVGDPTDDGGLAYPKGTIVSLRAAPDEGSEFSGWTGDVTSQDMELSLLLDVESQYITASFDGRRTSTLYIAVVGDGFVLRDPPGAALDDGGFVYDSGTVTTLSAVPAEGWQFLGFWIGDTSVLDVEVQIPLDIQVYEILAVFVEMAPPPPPAFGEALLLAQDGTFLGNINDDPFDPDSLANPFGTYGSTFGSDSIWNQFGNYGSEFATYSPWNEFSFNPPGIYIDQAFYGYLTANTTLGGIHPNDLAAAIGRYDVIR